MRLLETGTRFIRELRKWNLAPLGAVLVALIICAGAFAFVVTAHDHAMDFDGMIRTYFETKSAGSAPPAQARLIDVTSCTPVDLEDVQGDQIYKCTFSFQDEGFVSCFAFDHGRVAAGSMELGDPEGYSSGNGCDRVAWDASERSLVVP